MANVVAPAPVIGADGCVPGTREAGLVRGGTTAEPGSHREGNVVRRGRIVRVARSDPVARAPLVWGRWAWGTREGAFQLRRAPRRALPLLFGAAVGGSGKGATRPAKMPLKKGRWAWGTREGAFQPQRTQLMA